MKEDFTQYDIKPEEFINYLRYYGEHFNKKLCEFACKQLDKANITKEKLEIVLQQSKVELKNSKLYDAVYLINWLKSTFFGSSIKDEKTLCLMLKDLLDKEDNLIFNRWYADCAKKGIPVEWEDMI